MSLATPITAHAERKKRMKAVVVYGSQDIRHENREVKAPGPGEVLIRVEAAGLCGTDADIVSGELIYFQNGMASLPVVPGHEWAGTIEELGEGVQGFQAGDRVTGECTVSCGHCEYCSKGLSNLCVNRTETGVMNRDGGYAEYITFPVTSLHKCNGLTCDEGACVEPTCVAMSAILNVKVAPMDNVLVVGPGPIGLMAAQIAKKVFHANQVFLSGTREDRLARAADYGLDGIINVKEQDLAAFIREKTDGKMVDVIIEAAGASTAFEDAEHVLRPGGRISLLSFFGDKQVKCNWDFISTNGITVFGSLGSPGVWPFTIEKLEDGTISAESIISHRLPLKSKMDFDNAFHTMVNRVGGACKIILHP